MPDKISRDKVIQGVLSLFNNPNYLEIGVSEGATFHNVTAAQKVAVDPRFRFDVSAVEKNNPEASYHPVTSDEYFGSIIEETEKFDVIYIDGLHTFDQTLRDFANSIAHLATGGIIVIDDVLPSSYFASIRDLDVLYKLRSAQVAPDGAWMGDVYRLVYFIQNFYQSFSYRTIKDNHGQLVVWNKSRPSVPQATVETISRLPYETVLLNRQAFKLMPFSDILSEITPFVKEHSTKAK
jgi:hypothetical protein